MPYTTIQQADALQQSVREFLKLGLTDKEIINRLQSETLHPQEIESIIDNIDEEKDVKKPFKHLMVLGFVLIAIGAIFGAMTYKVAEKFYSPHFLLLCAIILSGIAAIARALMLYKKNS